MIINDKEFFFFSSRRRHTRFDCDWSSDVCSSDLKLSAYFTFPALDAAGKVSDSVHLAVTWQNTLDGAKDRKSTRLNSSHSQISYAVFCLKKKKKNPTQLATPTTTTAKKHIYALIK